MQTKVYQTNNVEDQRMFQIFFKAWIDDICQNKVDYIIRENSIKVNFEESEDASILELKGIPSEFEKYLHL